MARIRGSHPRGPGSIPGSGVSFCSSLNLKHPRFDSPCGHRNLFLFFADSSDPDSSPVLLKAVRTQRTFKKGAYSPVPQYSSKVDLHYDSTPECKRKCKQNSPDITRLVTKTANLTIVENKTVNLPTKDSTELVANNWPDLGKNFIYRSLKVHGTCALGTRHRTLNLEGSLIVRCVKYLKICREKYYFQWTDKGFYSKCRLLTISLELRSLPRTRSVYT